MAKRDAYNRVFPFRIRYHNKAVANQADLNAYNKLLEKGLGDLERAVGDIYNTENATGSALADQPLYINSLGRAVGPMSAIEPPLSGVTEASPTLARRLEDATYNVIPSPNQTVKCEVGCKFDATATATASSRSCLKGRTAFYRQVEGAQTGVCQNTTCPDWSGRDGRNIDTSICDPDEYGNTFREYKLVCPPELRSVDTYDVKFYANCGSNYDRYRVDTGGSSWTSDNRSEPANSYALANNANLVVSGVGDEIRYEFPNLNTDAGYIVIVEVPPVNTNQIVSINGVPQATIVGTTTESTRALFDLTSVTGATRLLVSSKPTSLDEDDIAAISQIWVIEKASERHRNYGIPLILPEVLDDLAAGTEIPPNFVQVFDTASSVNRILDKVRVFSARFNPESPDLNRSTTRDSFDVMIFGDQKLAVGNSRYLAVTVGTSVATAVGALLDAFVEHVTNDTIHLSRERVCELLADASFCCDDRLKAEIASLEPATRVRPNSPANYTIRAYIYGGFPPYTITVDWGDGVSDVTQGIVSGVQTYSLNADVKPDAGDPVVFTHTYSGTAQYILDFDVADNADVFGCETSLTSQVSPFTVGSAPDIVPQVRLDRLTSYPSFVYRDVLEGYAFTSTAASDWTTNPIYHVLTQVQNTDEEQGKPVNFSWRISNPNGLTFQFYYENVSGVQNESLSIVAGAGSLANDFIQHKSLVLRDGDQVFVEGTDYSVDYAAGTVTVFGSGIGSTDTVTADYFHYYYATVLADVSGVNQWVTLGSAVSDADIDLSDYTARLDLNTIRFKLKES